MVNATWTPLLISYLQLKNLHKNCFNHLAKSKEIKPQKQGDKAAKMQGLLIMKYNRETKNKIDGE